MSLSGMTVRRSYLVSRKCFYSRRHVIVPSGTLSGSSSALSVRSVHVPGPTSGSLSLSIFDYDSNNDSEFVIRAGEQGRTRAGVTRSSPPPSRSQSLSIFDFDSDSDSEFVTRHPYLLSLCYNPYQTVVDGGEANGIISGIWSSGG